MFLSFLDDSYTAMAQDIAGNAVAEKILGEDGKGTTLGAAGGGALGGALDKSLGPLGKLGLGTNLGTTLGGLGDNTFGLLGKKVAGNVAKEAIKGVVKGGMDAQGMGKKRKKRDISFDFSTDTNKNLEGVARSNAELFVELGWTGQDAMDDLAHAFDPHVFIGFGPCPKIGMSQYPLMEGPGVIWLSENDAINFYLGLLRVQCLDVKVNEVRELISKGYLQQVENYFVVPTTLSLL